jgi:hypothetical protein
LGIREYPQFVLIDAKTNQGQLLDLRHKPGQQSSLIFRLRSSEPVKGFDVIEGIPQNDKGGPEFLILAKRLKTLILDDWVFGIILVVMNIVFIGFAWKVSGIAVNAIVHLVYEITGITFAEPFLSDLSGSTGIRDNYVKQE